MQFILMVIDPDAPYVRMGAAFDYVEWPNLFKPAPSGANLDEIAGYGQAVYLAVRAEELTGPQDLLRLNLSSTQIPLVITGVAHTELHVGPAVLTRRED